MCSAGSDNTLQVASIHAVMEDQAVFVCFVAEALFDVVDMWCGMILPGDLKTLLSLLYANRVLTVAGWAVPALWHALCAAMWF